MHGLYEESRKNITTEDTVPIQFLIDITSHELLIANFSKCAAQ